MIEMTFEDHLWCVVNHIDERITVKQVVEEWFAYMSCRCGDSPVEAYRDWLEDCRHSLEVYDAGR